MRSRVALVFLFCICIGCNKDIRPDKPKNLIEKEQMTDIIYDLYIINGAKNVNKGILEEQGFQPEDYVLKKYNIDSLQFAQSNTYYAFDPDVYREIVEAVRLRLETAKDNTQELQKTLQKENRQRQDSLKKTARRPKKPIDSSNIRLRPAPVSND